MAVTGGREGSGDGAGTALIQPVTEVDWPNAKAIRLELLADTPLAYLETLASAQARTDDEWRARARRNQLPGNAAFAAVDPSSGRWVGIMNSFRRDHLAHLVSVYVAPDRRGREHGTTDALLDRIIEWAREQEGVRELRLEVHEHNGRATAYYRRRGFRMTGDSTPYTLDRSQLDLEMALPLEASARTSRSSSG